MTAKLLSRDAILGASDIKTEDVSVPEWGGTVRVRGLDAKQRDEFESGLIETVGKTQRVTMRNARARLAALSIVGEDNEPLFSPADVFLLGEKSGAALDRVFAVASRLSGIGDSDMDELTKNSSGQSDDSSSD
jgi:hypothetical protein